MLILFWICLAIIAYVYFGYPLLLCLGCFGRRKPIKQRSDSTPRCPTVGVIIPAHNEESQISAKIENTLASAYPRDRLEILIGSDGSSDATEEIVRRFADQGVGLISFPRQHGKSAIQNRLVSLASGDFLILTDADCFIGPDAIPLALENFSDPVVGLVTARPRYVNEGETTVTQNEGLYLRYETWLRRQESARGLLAIASGSFVAIRRSLWQPLEPGVGDDFVLPLRMAEAGLRSVLDERISVVTHLSENQPGAMLRTKIRIISKDFRALIQHKSLLNPLRHGGVAISLLSHKLLRWLVPYFLVGLFLTDCFLFARPIFVFALVLQIAFHALALLGYVFRNRLRGIASLPFSFCLVNLAALIATAKAVTKRPSGRWSTSRQPAARLPRDPNLRESK